MGPDKVRFLPSNGVFAEVDRLLGVDEPLQWKHDAARRLVIELPGTLQPESARPCRPAYVFKIEEEAGRTKQHSTDDRGI